MVENRPGAGGTVGSAFVAKSKPDGYTLLMTATGPAVLNQLLFKSVPYDTDRDFAPVILVGEEADVRAAVTAMREGAVDFIEKPHIDIAILRRVAYLLDHQVVKH